MRPELQTVLAGLPQMAPEQLPELLGELEVIRATAQLRMSAPSPALAADEQLDIGAAATRLGVSRDYLYRHANQFPFARREGRNWRFSGQGIAAYISKKTSTAVLTAKRHERILSLSSSR